MSGRLTEMPTFLDHAVAENEAAALARGLDAPNRGWEGLVAVAQSIMARFQDLPDGEGLGEELLDYGDVAPVVAAARIFDSLAVSEDDEAEALDLSVQAMVCYAMFGNFPAAAAVARRARLLDVGSPATLAIVGACCPVLVGACLNRVGRHRDPARFLTLANALPRTPQIRASDLEDALGGLLPSCDAFEAALLLSCRLVVHQLARLAARPSLRRAGLGEQLARRIVDAGVVTLLPPQIRAIEGGLLERGGNAFVSLPTSAGKTLLGELCMLRALADRDGVSVFVAPYLAIGRQVAAALKAHAPDGVAVQELFGSEGVVDVAARNAPKVAMVATPERFDGLLRQGGLSARLRCVVVDEAHLVDNDVRGVRLEGVVTRLRLLQGQGLDFRIVALSAVIAGPAAFCEWLGVPEDARFVDAWRPTARRLGTWTEDGLLTWYRSEDVLRPSNTRRTSTLGRKLLPWPERAPSATAMHGVVKKERPRVYRNVAYLCEYLNAETSPPTLCICGTRAATRVLAAALADRREASASLGPRQAELVDLVEGEHAHLRPLADMVRRGVAYHNASLPAAVRALVEEAVRERSLSAVAATTTLAEGVDLPFRNTVVVDWLLYRDGVERPMPPLLFRNIAGRCGRAGTFTEGDTIVFDNMLGDLAHTAPHVRKASRESLLAEPAPLSSLLGRELGASGHSEAEAELGSQFMAAIAENPANDDLASDFADATFGARTPQRDAVRARVAEWRASLLGERGGPAFARAASPLHLTELGAAANASGLSPRSALAVVDALRSVDFDRDVPSVIEALLLRLSDLPEQHDARWKRKLSKPRTRLMVGRDDLRGVASAWLAGVGPEVIFASLPAVARSTRRPRIEAWVAGRPGTEDWAGEFDKFLDFVGTVLARFLPSVLRACTLICPAVGADPVLATRVAQVRQAVVDRLIAPTSVPAGQDADAGPDEA